MKATVELDKVLDLLSKHQEDLAGRIDCEYKTNTAYTALWKEYKAISQLYDDIRRAAE